MSMESGSRTSTEKGAAPPEATPNLQGRSHKRTCTDPQPGHAACFAEVLSGLASNTVAPNTAPPGYSPQDIWSAYALPAVGGVGATVAVVDAFDLSSAEADLAIYRHQFGLPPCATANGCFRKVDQRGGQSFPASDPGWGPETDLDIEMVSAACPQCAILLVEASSTSLVDLGTAVNTAVQMGAKYVSNSYGTLTGSAGYSSFETYYDHPGVVITASSGDVGTSSSPQYPASSPFVTAVGGTSLVRSPGTARGWSETVWSGAGSGCGQYGVKPTWQKDTGCATKTVSDVSAVADPNTGVAGYIGASNSTGQSGWVVFGGTSTSAPLIASMYALAGTPTPGTYPASYPYSHISELNDVTSGSNGTCSISYHCTGGPGYDGPTGLGTPNGVKAFAATSITTPPPAPAQGDFNSDGHADVLARTSSGAFFLHRGNGSGGWLSPAAAEVGSGWNGMTALVSPGDFDGDGRNDVLARDSAGALWLYPGNGSSGWDQRRQVGSGWNGMSTLVAGHDFAGDGNPDILAVDGSGVLWLYPGDGKGGWLAARSIGSGWNSMTAIIGIGDFDSDGFPDLLARDSAGTLWLYPRTPSGWKPRAQVGSGWNGMTAIVSVGDVDGDGHDDVLARTSEGALMLYPGLGQSRWGAAHQIGAGWNSMSWIG
jgi:hypothetical protein